MDIEKKLAEAHRSAANACGSLCHMIVLRRVRLSELERSEKLMRESADTLRSLIADTKQGK